MCSALLCYVLGVPRPEPLLCAVWRCPPSANRCCCAAFSADLSLAFAVRVCCYALCGTELAYGAGHRARDAAAGEGSGRRGGSRGHARGREAGERERGRGRGRGATEPR
eukprot:3863318-Rhodomonas_salina.1